MTTTQNMQTQAIQDELDYVTMALGAAHSAVRSLSTAPNQDVVRAATTVLRRALDGLSSHVDGAHLALDRYETEAGLVDASTGRRIDE